MCAYQAVLTDFGSVENDTADPNQGFLLDGAAVQHYHMADRDLAAKGYWKPRISVEHATILNLRALADGDEIIISTDDRMKPDTNVTLQDHPANEDSARRYPRFGVNFGTPIFLGIGIPIFQGILHSFLLARTGSREHDRPKTGSRGHNSQLDTAPTDLDEERV